MPVLINKRTQLAEDISDQDLPGFLHHEDYEVPLINPEGEPVGIPYTDAGALLQQGFTQPNTEQLQDFLTYAKMQSPGEQAKTFAEGLASGATFGGSTALEVGAGVNPEDIRARAEEHPGTHILGEMFSLLTPVSGAIGAAGKGAQTLAKGLGITNRIGSTAAKIATETAMIESGNEVSKMFAQDPHQSLGTAVANIGTSALWGAGLGAGLGVVSPLWKATLEPKLNRFLGGLSKKINGEPMDFIPESVEQAIKQSGVSIPPEVVAAVSDDPELKRMFQYLQESQTHAGKKAQDALQKFRTESKDAILNALGKTGKDIEALPDLSNYQMGESVKEKIIQELEPVIKKFNSEYSVITDKFTKERLPVITGVYGDVKYSTQNEILEKLGNFSEEGGFLKKPESVETKEINEAIKDVPNLGTLEDLREYQTRVRNATYADPKTRYVGGKIIKILRDAEEKALTEMIEAKAPELKEFHAALRKRYGNFKEFLEDLNDRLKVGKYEGGGTFIHNLEETRPETLLDRLTKKKDAGLLELLSERLPETSQLVREQFLNNALKKASLTGEFSAKKFFSEMRNQWTPELRQFAIPEQSVEKLNALETILDRIPGSGNPPHTASMYDQISKHGTAGVGAMVSLLTGHGVSKGFFIGSLMRLATREAPDAMKLATLKFLGSDAPLSGAGFKVMADWISAIQKGEKLINGSVKKIFTAGQDIVPTLHEKEKEQIRKKVDNLAQNPEKLLDIGGDTGHYMPEYASALGEYAVRSLNYLQSVKPKTNQGGVLNSEMPVSQAEKARYDRAIEITERPLSVFNYMKKGMLTSQDMQTLISVHPEMYQRLSEKVILELINQKSKGENIPYQLRLGLSTFLGQPLDESMTPFALQSTFSILSQQSGQEAPQTAGSPAPSKSMTQLGKLPKNYATPSQGREMFRANRRGA